MKQQAKHIHPGERGEAALMVALVAAGVVGTTVYFAMQKTNLAQQQQQQTLAHDRVSELHSNALTRASALMTYLTPNPTASDGSAWPMIFPEPYIGDNPQVNAVRDNINLVTPAWSYDWTGATLTVSGPPSTNLHSADFAALADYGKRPTLTQASQVQFLGPIYAPAPNQYWIKSFKVNVTTESIGTKSNYAMTSTALVPVPPVPPPTCTLKTANGQTVFQPNTPVPLVLTVAGVSPKAYIPITAQDITSGAAGNYTTYKPVDLTSQANSVSNLGKVVQSWKATSPRPLSTYDYGDGNQMVPFTVVVAIDAVDNKGKQTCSLTLGVTPPASCRLHTKTPTLQAGSCATVNFQELGSAVPGSFTISAADLAGDPLPGTLTKSGDNSYQFCPPAVPPKPSGTQVPVPDGLAQKYAAATSTLSIPQLIVLYGAMQQEIALWTGFFTPALATPVVMSLDQTEAFSSLGQAQLLKFASLNLAKSWPALKELTSDQQAALGSTVAGNPAYIPLIHAMNPPDLGLLPIMTGVSSDTIDTLKAFDPTLFSSYLLQAIAAKQATAPAVDYMVTGTVQDPEGNTNSCILTPTVGTNNCPFYGPQAGTYSQNVSIYINFCNVNPNVWGPGLCATTNNFAFTADPDDSWQVAATASTPTDSTPCPLDARCYAWAPQGNVINNYFVIVEPADDASCVATGMSRIDLGCFAFHTKIRMGDGSDREINRIKQGDLVYNPLKHKSVRVKRTVLGPEKDPLVVFTAGKRSLHVTTKHPMLTKTGVRAAIELATGDSIMDDTGRWLTIDRVAREQARLAVINLELETDATSPEDHAVLADGLITGDLYIQEWLAGQHRSAVASQK